MEKEHRRQYNAETNEERHTKISRKRYKFNGYAAFSKPSIIKAQLIAGRPYHFLRVQVRIFSLRTDKSNLEMAADFASLRE